MMQLAEPRTTYAPKGKQLDLLAPPKAKGRAEGEHRSH